MGLLLVIVISEGLAAVPDGTAEPAGQPCWPATGGPPALGAFTCAPGLLGSVHGSAMTGVWFLRLLLSDQKLQVGTWLLLAIATALAETIQQLWPTRPLKLVCIGRCTVSST